MHQGCPSARLGSLTTLLPTRFVIIGGGPGGNTAANYAARHGAERIAVVALAVTAGLTVHDIQESLFVHPTLSKALAEAAE